MLYQTRFIFRFILIFPVILFFLTNAEAQIIMNEEIIFSTADERIEKTRKDTAEISVINDNGQPIQNVAISAELINHEFLFGCNIFILSNLSGKEKLDYQMYFAGLFNYATLPFYLKDYEPEKGNYLERKNNNITTAKWCLQNKIKTKGHPLIWHELYPDWTGSEPDDAKRNLKERVTREITTYKGLIDIWDVINETTVSHQFENGVGNWVKRDGVNNVVSTSLEWARDANPKAILLYNDFNIFSPDTENLVKYLVDNKKPIDAFGLQSHMHKENWSLLDVWQVCEKYSKYGLPLHFTELTVISGKNGWMLPEPWQSTPSGEKVQAAYVEKIYTLLFSHPSVTAITWWDFADYGWQGAPSGLLNNEYKPKPAYYALSNLINKKWHTRCELETDVKGKCSMRGFRGDYRLTIHYKGEEYIKNITLKKGRNIWDIKISKLEN